MTGASCAMLLRRDGDALTVLATAGATDPVLATGSSVPAQGARGFAIASGQPTALLPSPGDRTNDGIGGHPGVPANLIVAAEGAAVVEVAGKIGADAFSFDDIETLAALAEIAGAAIADAGEVVDAAPDPSELAAQLTALAHLDPARYRDVARVVTALLAG